MHPQLSYTIYKPSPDIAHIVKYYFLYTNGNENWHKEYALSDGNPGLCFALENPYHFIEVDEKPLLTSYAFVSGAFSKGIYVHKVASQQTMFGVKFTVDGFYHVLRTYLSELQQKPVWDAAEVLGDTINNLTGEIKATPELVHKVKLLEAYVRKAIQRNTLPDYIFHQAVSSIRQANGQISIDEVANRLKVNYKWLERKFKQYAGVSPKEFSRLIRFARTYLDFKKESTKDLMSIAINNGYYDQNHFIKEFKHFTAYTPTQLLHASVNDLASIMEPSYKNSLDA